jgi:adenylate cyclase
MLNALIERPHEWAALEGLITERFAQQKAVMVVDMSGFSTALQLQGAIAVLLMIHQLRRLSEPVIEARGGVVIKSEADNLFAVFDTVDAALGAGFEIMRALDSTNTVVLYASIGIGYGPILNIGNERIAGSEVNLAFKLGEDIAECGEIHLTASALAAVGDSEIAFERRQAAVSGLAIDYYALRRRR